MAGGDIEKRDGLPDSKTGTDIEAAERNFPGFTAVEIQALLREARTERTR